MRGIVVGFLVHSVALLLLGGCTNNRVTNSPIPSRYAVAAYASESAPVEEIAIKEIHMVTKYHGWAIALDGVFRTLDGGVSWSSAAPPGVKKVNGSSADWFFLDSTTAWLLVDEERAGESRGVLFTTIDGGKHWSRYEVPFASASLFIAGYGKRTMGWALKRYGPALGSEPVDLYRMKGDGAWILVHRGECPSDPGAGRDRLPFGGIKKSVGFMPDGKTGWTIVEHRAPDRLGFYMTTDGGKTWRVPDLPIPLHLEGSIIEVGQVNHGILPVIFHLAGGESRYGDFAAVFFVTEDNGASWRAASILRAKGCKPLIAVADAADWWVQADSLSESSMYATHDAGATWAEMNGVRRALQVQFVTPADGWALSEDNGRSVLLRTTDGGNNWLRVPVKRKTIWPQ